MCTNSARLVNSLECYMDDLVDCFEDFVKKSLFIISIAVGALILMLGYVLKVVTDRPEVERRSRRAATGISAQNFPTLPKDSTTAADAQPSSGMLPQTSVNSVTIPVLRECRKTSSAGANTGPMSSVPSFDEKILRNVGLSSCSKSCMQGKRSLIRNCSGTRIVIPSVPNCIPNRMYTRLRPRSGPAQNNRTCASRNLRNFRDYRALASHVSRYIWTAYNMMYGNYLALATVFAVVILSFLIPDISQKIHKTSELKSMKKVLNVMTKEVGRAEVACLTAADEICCLHCSMEDDATETQQPRNFQNMSVCSCHYIRPTMSEPMQIEKKIGFFNRIFLPHRNTSHKEIAIMSYVYTDSFNAEKKIELTDLYDEILPTRSTATFTSDSS